MGLNRWSVLALLSLARTAMAIQFQTVASLGPTLVERFGIEFTQLGVLIGLYMLPGVLIALPGGVLGGRFGAKPAVLAGLALMVVGGVLTAIDSLAIIVFGRLLSGAGAVLMNVLLTKMVADWFTGREIGTAMAVLVSSWPLGLALGLLFFPPLTGVLGWQGVMLFSAMTAVFWLAAIAVIYRDPPDAPAPERMALDLGLTRREWVLVSLAGCIWGVFNVGYIVLVSFLPGLFETRGYTFAEASGLVSLLGWAMIALVPAGGYLADRLGRPDAVTIASAALAALATAALPFVAMPGGAFLVLVLVVGLPAGPMVALPAVALRPQNRATGMGVAYTWFYGLMATLPAVAGMTRDLTQSVAAPVLFAAATMLVAILCLAAFRVTHRSPAPAAG